MNWLVLWLIMQTTVTMSGHYRATSSATLTWVASTSPGVVSYKIYRLDGDGDSSYDLVAAGVPCCKWDDLALQSGHAYTYRAKAVDDQNNESGYSSDSNTVVIP